MIIKIDELLENLGTVMNTLDIYSRPGGYYSAGFMVGLLIAQYMHHNPKEAKETFNKVRSSNTNAEYILKGMVLWAQETGVSPTLPAFYSLMNHNEKIFALKTIKEVIDQEYRISPMAFELLVFLCNDDPDMQAYILDNRNVLDMLFEMFDKAIDVTDCFDSRDRFNEQFRDRFMRLFAFLKGHSLSTYATFFRHHTLSSNLDGLKLVYMLRMLRTLGIKNFQKVWKETMNDNKKINNAAENHCRVRGLRRLSRMIWKDFDHRANFIYYDWAKDFGDFDHISRGNYYYPPDKPCNLLANNGQMAIIRMTGKRYVLVNHKSVGLVFPCKGKTRDPWLILADMTI